MPRIFDNIAQELLPALRQTLAVSDRSDFCVGYFNLRGWKAIDEHVEQWPGGDGRQCRLLVGMQRLEEAELRDALQRVRRGELLDIATARRMREQAAKAFKEQLTWGCPTRDDEAALRRLSAQLRAKKLAVKLFLSHPLHAKLYLCFRADPNNPITGFLGSSNLTFSGLSAQGELNVDVLDHDATNKRKQWFNDRWADRWCLDITDELADIIDQSWARPDLLPPYHVYLKMAWHLSEEARESQHRFKLPKKLHEELFPFQRAAVLVAAGHLEKRGGVLLGDVVGLGKTFMATALARLMEDRHDLQTLILCPPNLAPMWKDYRSRYGLRGEVMSLGKVVEELPKQIRHRLVIVDESHNLRNREGSRYKAVRDYIAQNAEYTVLLSATPFNKEFADVANQLRLFLSDDDDLGVRPERWLRDLTAEDIAHLQINPKTLRAFQESPFPDDWRDLMRLFLVRRTRSFIEKHYAEKDETKDRYFITYADGRRAYFPKRQPRTVKFDIDETDQADQYAALFSPAVVDTIGHLHLPRYGLQKYLHLHPLPPPDAAEQVLLNDLNRAGKRLIGYVRTNLFKRLESCGHSFLLSLQRHILRNHILLHALNSAKPLPIGTQLGDILEASDTEEAELALALEQTSGALQTEADFASRAAALYQLLATTQKSKFRWVRPGLFSDELAEHLRADAEALRAILEKSGEWDAARDAKLRKLLHLVAKKHKGEKLLIFSQFADTVRYLEKQFEAAEVSHLRAVTGDDPDPTAAAWAFIMEEATEIARLRLFLALVASAQTEDQLEPLPNIDFNILAGNSLIGLLHVDPKKFDGGNGSPASGEQGRMTLQHGSDLGFTVESKTAPTKKETVASFIAQQNAARFAAILEDKNKSIELYRKHAFQPGAKDGLTQEERLIALRSHIEKVRAESYARLNQMLLDEFNVLGIQFEQATWDDRKNDTGKPEKRRLKLADIEALHPFHWGYEFDRVMADGGFDGIITNPPWDVLEADEKEFFQQFKDSVRKKKIRIEEWNKQFKSLMKDEELRTAWLSFVSELPHQAKYFKSASQYRRQLSVVDGRVAATKINLFKLFLEQCFNLLRPSGCFGMITPGSIYTDRGAMQLRKMLFEEAELSCLFGLSNERFIFEEVHHAQKFCLITLSKGGRTQTFEASFRINPREAVSAEELDAFLHGEHLHVPVTIVRNLSPDSLSIMEFRSQADMRIAEKLMSIPFLGGAELGAWSVLLAQELNMTSDSDLFRTSPGNGRLPLIEGKMIWQFNHCYAKPRYWLGESEARERIIGRELDSGQRLPYQDYRFSLRRIAASTNERTAIATLLPPNCYCADTALTVRNFLPRDCALFLTAIFNSFVVDWDFRLRVTTHLDMHFVYKARVPRLTAADAAFGPIVKRAAQLICTTPEFDALAKEAGLGSHKSGVTAPAARAQLRAELDGLIAHLYALTESEFAHILTTFPLVAQPVKDAALEAYRAVAKGGLE